MKNADSKIDRGYKYRATALRNAVKLFGLNWRAKADIIEDEGGGFRLLEKDRPLQPPKKDGITKRVWETASKVVKETPGRPKEWRREVFARCSDLSVGTVASTYASWKKVNEGTVKFQ